MILARFYKLGSIFRRQLQLINSSYSKFNSAPLTFHRLERAQAMIEFAITAPVIFLLIIGTIDIGRGLNGYLILTQVVHEGVRFAGSRYELEPGAFENVPAAAASGCGTTSPSPCEMHRDVQKRVRQLYRAEMTSRNLPFRNAASAIIKTKFTPTAENPAIANNIDDDVTVSLTTNLKAFFPLFDGISVTVTASGPYLFRSSE